MTGLLGERVYSWAIIAAGWLYIAWAVVSGGLERPLTLLLFAVFATLAEIWPAHLRAGKVSILTAFLVPAVVLLGSGETALVLAAGSLSAGLVHRRPAQTMLFNAAQYALSIGLAGFVTSVLVHLHVTGALNVAAVLFYYVVFLVMNHAIVDAYFLLVGFSWRTAVLDGLGLDLLQSVVTLPLGLSVVVAFDAYRWFGVFAISTALVLLGYAFNLQETLRQRNRNLEVLYEFHGKFARAQDGGAILQELRDSLAAIYGTTAAYAAVCEDRGALVALPGSSLAPQADILEEVSAGGRELILDSASLANGLSASARSGLMFPIMIRTGCYGIVAFAWPYELRFEQEDRHLFRAAVQLATIACEKEQLLRETARLAATDPRLPGLYNYRYLIDRLDREVARNRRDGTKLALVYIDLDGFKQCNDRYGHLAGDEALREFANLLGAHIRAHDVAARYAGDEFVLLLPDSAEDLAYQVAQRLREETESRRFLASVAKDGVRLTFSYGVASDEAGRMSPRELIDAADRAMYLDKQGGSKTSRR